MENEMSKGIRAGVIAVESILAVLAVAALAVSACGGSKASMVAAGDTVSVKYKLTLDNGTVADSSMDSRPLQFVVGQGQMIKGFDAALMGMKLNEEKTVTVPPEEAYGPRDTMMFRNYPRASLPEGMAPEVGMTLQMNTPGGPMPVKVVEVTADSLKLDLNHPLAGENLNFAIKLVALAKGVAPQPAEAAPGAEAPKAN